MIVVVLLVLVVPMVAAIIAVSVTVAITIAEMGSAIIAVVVLIFGERQSAENQRHAQKHYQS